MKTLRLFVASGSLGRGNRGLRQRESSVKRTTTVSTPEGKTTETMETTVDTHGKNPPAAPNP